MDGSHVSAALSVSTPLVRMNTASEQEITEAAGQTARAAAVAWKSGAAPNAARR